jgi:hypothetical protein
MQTHKTPVCELGPRIMARARIYCRNRDALLQPKRCATGLGDTGIGL